MVFKLEVQGQAACVHIGSTRFGSPSNSELTRAPSALASTWGGRQAYPYPPTGDVAAAEDLSHHKHFHTALTAQDRPNPKTQLVFSARHESCQDGKRQTQVCNVLRLRHKDLATYAFSSTQEFNKSSHRLLIPSTPLHTYMAVEARSLHLTSFSTSQ